MNDAIDRRGMMIGAALLTGLTAVPAARGAEETRLGEAPLDSGATVTIQRQGQVALFGLNRPSRQNRVDPPTFRALAAAYYAYEHDPSLRAAVLFGHGANFTRGIDVDAYQVLFEAKQPVLSGEAVLNPLGKNTARLSKPLVVAVHGETWNMGHELFLNADIRIAAADTDFGQDETSHGRFPGGGGTIRFVAEAGWGNAMRYMLTGEHWSAAEAYRMGTVQEVLPSAEEALAKAIEIAEKIAACAPLSIKTTLASAHMVIDPAQGPALAQLDAHYRGLYGTRDFQEGRDAEAQNRPPVYTGK